jgi:hypothetical protein
MKKLAFLFLLFALPCFAQTPSSASMNFNLGAGAFGLGGTNATPATDVALSLNPGIKKLPEFALRSDNLLDPGENMQFFGGGGNVTLPQLSKTGLLSKVHFEVNATFGLDRVTPPTGPTQAHFGLMVGASLHYSSPTGVDLNLFQVGFLRTPGVPNGANRPYFGGSVSYFWGKQ